MKRAVLILLACASAALAQTNWAGAGATYNPGGSPAIAGTALYARNVTSAGTYAFTVFDAIPTGTKPFTIDTAVSVGVAQKVFSLGTVNVFVPTAAGISYTGTHTGWAWSTGALACIPLGKSTWRLMPNARVVKSSVTPAGTGYQVMGGLMIGWGW